MKGADLSQWNPVTNWAQVKKSLGFVILRAGYGLNTVDKTFKSKIEGAIAAGLNVGIYWFSYALTPQNAKAEAQFCKKTIAPYKKHINLPVYFDYEYDSMDYAHKNGVYPTRQSVTDMCKAFCAEIEKEYPAGVYSNLDYYNRWIDKSQLTQYSHWYANWGIKKCPAGYDIWQYSSDGSVPGISGRVDMNELINESINGKPKPSPAPTPTKKLDFTYAVRIQGGTILPAVKNLEDYAGVQGRKITDIAIKASTGKLRYRVHVLGGDWLPWVTGYNWKDAKAGYAGNGKPIDLVQVELTGVTGQVAQYRVSPVRKGYYDWQYNVQTTGGQDGYAGGLGTAIDRFQVF